MGVCLDRLFAYESLLVGTWTAETGVVTSSVFTCDVDARAGADWP